MLCGFRSRTWSVMFMITCSWSWRWSCSHHELTSWCGFREWIWSPVIFRSYFFTVIELLFSDCTSAGRSWGLWSNTGLFLNAFYLYQLTSAMKILCLHVKKLDFWKYMQRCNSFSRLNTSKWDFTGSICWYQRRNMILTLWRTRWKYIMQNLILFEKIRRTIATHVFQDPKTVGKCQPGISS